MVETKNYKIAGCKIIGQIYESAYSQVYRAYDLDEQPIILKVLKEDALMPVRVAEYRREYSITQSLTVAGVASVRELRINHHRPALVMEDFGGESLDLLGLAGHLPLSAFLPLAISLAHTLSQIHAQQVVHKDINPSNIVFNRKTAEAKLIDFGLASILPQEITSFGCTKLVKIGRAHV